MKRSIVVPQYLPISGDVEKPPFLACQSRRKTSNVQNTMVLSRAAAVIILFNVGLITADSMSPIYKRAKFQSPHYCGLGETTWFLETPL